MNKKTMTTVTMTPDGKTKKTIVEYKDGIKTERVFIDGIEQKKINDKVAPTTSKAEEEHVVIFPDGSRHKVSEEIWKALENQMKANEREKMERAKRMAEIQAQLEAEKARIKKATEEKINQKIEEERREREEIKEAVTNYRKYKEEHGKFLVRFFVRNEERRIAEKRFMRAEDIYRPQLGECVYLDGWLVDEGDFVDKYYDTRFIVVDVTMCLGEEGETVLIDIDLEPYDDECLGYTTTGWDC